MGTDAKTFKGRTLEEILPQIREELGPDAIVLRRREGLAGGVGGFFQKSYVEVEARRPLASERDVDARNDRATTEGLSTPAIQALIQQASPFADALARAEISSSGERAADVLLAAAAAAGNPAGRSPGTRTGTMPARPAALPARAGLYGPQPRTGHDGHGAATAVSERPAAPLVAGAHAAASAPAAPVVPSWPPAPVASPPASWPPVAAAPDPPPAPEAATDPPSVPTAEAAAAEARLVAAGLSHSLAAEVVGETLAHVLPFTPGGDLDALVRSTLARRLSIMAGLDLGARVLAVAGAGGAGKSTLVARLASAYAAADHEVVVVALGTRDGGGQLASELEPLGVSVIAAADAEQALRRLRHREAFVCLVDTPALGARDAAAAAALAPELRALGCTEIHLAVPATVSAAAADEIADALAPLALTHMAITNVDQTGRPGAVVELAVRTGRPVSYLGSFDGVELADAGALARQLLP